MTSVHAKQLFKERFQGQIIYQQIEKKERSD
jgi:hypothetical protein